MDAALADLTQLAYWSQRRHAFLRPGDIPSCQSNVRAKRGTLALSVEAAGFLAGEHAI